MQKIKAKLMALITTICCFTLCLGFGIGAIVAPQTNNVVAQAASVRTITQAGSARDSSATALYLYALKGDDCPSGVGNWDDKYIFVDGTGEGINYNGKPLEGYEMKQPGDIYIGLGGKTAVVGDEVTLDGKFSNAGKGNDIVFKNCGLRYNGSTWDSFTPATRFTINKLAATGGSNASVITHILRLNLKDLL